MEFEEYPATDGTYVNGIKVSGEIRTDDDLRYVNFILGRGEVPRVLFLNESPGGNLSAAMNIGRLFRLGYARTHVGRDYCASSCVIMAIGSTQLAFDGPIHIHRPYFDDTFGSLGPSAAKTKYQQMLILFKSYLTEMATPVEIVERMLRQASDEAEELSSHEANRLLGGRAPWLEEWLIARCGRMDRGEADDFGSVLDASSQGESLPFSKSYRQFLINKSHSIGTCEHMTLRLERQRLYNLILESCGLLAVTEELEYRLQSKYGWADLAREDDEFGIQEYYYQEGEPIADEIVKIRKNQSYKCDSIDFDWVGAQMAE